MSQCAILGTFPDAVLDINNSCEVGQDIKVILKNSPF